MIDQLEGNHLDGDNYWIFVERSPQNGYGRKKEKEKQLVERIRLLELSAQQLRIVTHSDG